MPAVAETRAQPRIFLVTVRSGVNGKLAKVFTKVPYSGIYPLSETLARSMMAGEVSWFRLEPAKPRQITKNVRAALVRWPEALESMTERTGITWRA